MRKHGLAAAAMLALSAGVTSAPAQTPFVGKVTDAAGRPIAGVTLWVGAGAQRATTAPDGLFRLEVPQAGTYRVRLQRYGYQAIAAQVAVTPGAPGALFQLTRLRMPTSGDGRGAIRERMKPELELDSAQLAALPDFSVAEYLDRAVGYATRKNDVYGRPIVTWEPELPPWMGDVGAFDGQFFLVSRNPVSVAPRQGALRKTVQACTTYLDDACVYDDVRAHIAPGDLTRLRIVSQEGAGWSVLLTSKRGLDTPR